MQLQTWGKVDQSLWSQHFNRAAVQKEGGDALSIGPYQLQSEASGSDQNSAVRGGGKAASAMKGKDRNQPHKVAPICKKYNYDHCRSPSCGYRHLCIGCHGRHREPDCPGSTSNRKDVPKSTQPFRREGGGRDTAN